jgi:hypothetical protein
MGDIGRNYESREVMPPDPRQITCGMNHRQYRQIFRWNRRPREERFKEEMAREGGWNRCVTGIAGFVSGSLP